MKKLLTIAVLATLSTMTYAADKVIDTDIVVVGQGAAGTAAAFAAGELGAKVVGLEKKGLPGGTGNFSEGIFAVGTKMQRDYYIPLTKDETFKKIMNYGHWRSNARLVRAIVDKSADTVDWMIKHGVKFENLQQTIQAVSTLGIFMKAAEPVGLTSSRRNQRAITVLKSFSIHLLKNSL